jgi:hypothetical protein
LAQSIVLALLLHLWLVLVLGSAPAGVAKPGEGVWGRMGGVIDVRLTGSLGDRTEIAAAQAAPARPLTQTGPIGAAKQERFGGMVRTPTPSEPDTRTPGAVRLGRWNSQAGDALAQTPPNLVTALPREAVRPLSAAADLALQPLPARPPEAVEAAAPTTPAPLIEPAPQSVPAAAPTPVVAPSPTPADPTPAVPQATAQETATTPASAQPPAPTASPTDSTSKPSPYPAPAGSPDAGSRVGHDVATPASTPPTAARAPLNLSLPRGAASSRHGASGLLSMVPIPPDRKTKLEQEMEAAGKADCRKAYAGAGLLAAVPLALDAARDKGCRW